MDDYDEDSQEGTFSSIWRARVLRKPRCPNCDFELSEPSQRSDPDKLFIFGFLFATIGAAAGLEYTEGYGPHIFVLQIFLGVGLIAWSIFRYREMRKRRRRQRRHRSTPRLADVMPKGANVAVTPAHSNPKSKPDELASNLP